MGVIGFSVGYEQVFGLLKASLSRGLLHEHHPAVKSLALERFGSARGGCLNSGMPSPHQIRIDPQAVFINQVVAH